MYPRHRLDLKPRHLAYAGAACVWARDGDKIAAEIESAAPQGALVCFSVRSAFDLLLETLNLEPGGEVLMSAVTHPDMARVVERHGLVPLPVDPDFETLELRADLLERAAGPRACAVVVAHLFGARADLEEVAAFCERRRLLLVEDCAQSLRGPADSGHPAANAALFSFGSIKTSPALGGSIAYVRDATLRESMRRLQARWPAQPRREYALRVLRFAWLLALGRPLVYGLFVRIGGWAGLDVDELVNRSVHALKPPSSADSDDFGDWLRRRPSPPLLALLRHRLRTFDADRLRRRARRGEEAAAALPAGVFHPGRHAAERTHWVFPVACGAPERVLRPLRRAGFDATAATSSIAAIEAPADRPELRPGRAKALMSRVVFVPVYPELPDRAFRRLLGVLRGLEDEGLREGGLAAEARETVRS